VTLCNLPDACLVRLVAADEVGDGRLMLADRIVEAGGFGSDV
jgi:hypothetical protein